MVPALRVQHAVHQQMRIVLGQRLALLGGFARHHRRAQQQVGGHHGRTAVVKGQHVGGVVLAAEVAVELPALVGIDDAHGDLGRLHALVQRGAQPAHDPMARQRGAVLGHAAPAGELQRQAQLGPGHG